MGLSAMDVTPLLGRLLTFEAVSAIFGLYLAKIIVTQLYKLFIYPYYVSPLRNLPGPKVEYSPQ